MRKEILVGALCLTLGCITARAEGVPKIQFDSTVYDFGVTSAVSSLNGTFTFSNAGEGELTVQKPAPTCGCTVASVKPDHLKPGEKGELVFTLTVGNIATAVHKTIVVASNDPKTPSTTLSIKATIRPMFEIDPPSVFLGDLEPGASTSVVVRVKRLDGNPLKNVRAEILGSAIKAAIEVLPNSEERVAQVTVTAKNDGKSRRFTERVRLVTEETPPSVVEIPVYGRLMGEVDINPERVVWLVPERWPSARSGMNQQEVTITTTKPGPKLEVRNATSSLKQVEVELFTEEAGKKFRLMVKLPEPIKESIRGTLSFEINLPNWHVVEIPVTITVVKSNT